MAPIRNSAVLALFMGMFCFSCTEPQSETADATASQNVAEPEPEPEDGYGDLPTQRIKNKLSFEIIARSPNSAVVDLSDAELCEGFSAFANGVSEKPYDGSLRLYHFYYELLRRQVLCLGLSRDEVEKLLNIETGNLESFRRSDSVVSIMVIMFDESDRVVGLRSDFEGEAATGSFYISPGGNVW